MLNIELLVGACRLFWTFGVSQASRFPISSLDAKLIDSQLSDIEPLIVTLSKEASLNIGL